MSPLEFHVDNDGRDVIIHCIRRWALMKCAEGGAALAWVTGLGFGLPISTANPHCQSSGRPWRSRAVRRSSPCNPQATRATMRPWDVQGEADLPAGRGGSASLGRQEGAGRMCQGVRYASLRGTIASTVTVRCASSMR